jgi:O-antigen/teichoic acid export membrane protein
MVISRIVSRVLGLLSIGREALRGSQASGEKVDIDSIRRARYVKATRTTMTSGLATVLIAVTGFISVALTVRYLGIERYGLWLTISTLLAWLNLTDFGVGNALINKLSHASGRNQQGEAQNYVATAFWMLSLVGVLIIFAGIILGRSLPWASMLNVKSVEAGLELPLAITLSFVIYGLGFPLSITRNVYSGYQEGYYANLWDIAANVLSLISLVIVTRFNVGLPLLVAAVFGTRQIVLAASALFLFGSHRPWLMPSPRQVRKANLRPLLGLGMMFILLQVSALLISQTDNIVIIRVLGPAQVAIFGTTWKLFSYVGVLKSWFLAPLWPAYGEAYSRLDVYWIRRTLRYSLLTSVILTSLVSGGLAIFAREIVRVWAGPDLVPSINLVVSMALLQVMWAWTEPFVYFLNGISRLRGQMLYGLGTALISVAFKIIFVSHWGIEGAIGATLAAYFLLAAWLLPLDAVRGLKKMQISCARQNREPINV